MTNKAKRLMPTTRPRDWGFTDEELAGLETVYRPGLLDGKVYVVSGGGSGIGRGIAYLLARLGAEVMICGRRQEMLDETAAGIRRQVGREIATHSMTIRDPE
jgi:pyruvate/2-oxoglutarate dehydrogenase complex dihydrolipoamide dehydrogenase (E3) component